MRRDLEEFVRIGVEGLRSGELIVGKVETRRNIASAIIKRADILSTKLPELDASRLRTTWLAELMSEPIPLAVVMNASGLQSARTLTELVPFLTVSIDEAITNSVRGLAS